MRRILALLLLTPFLANCSSDTKQPLAPAADARGVRTPGAMHSDMVMDEPWPAEANWFTPDDAIEVVDDASQAMTTADASDAAAPASGAEMVFGNPDLGTDFHPTGVHDQSFQARDKIRPGSVSIKRGETVTFTVYVGHRVAIYNTGVRPDDIQPTPGPLLLYAPGRLFLQPSPIPQFKLKFVRSGKYLVLCAINQHFFTGNMWGWIIVQ